jgi:hypothetical protein
MHSFGFPIERIDPFTAIVALAGTGVIVFAARLLGAAAPDWLLPVKGPWKARLLVVLALGGVALALVTEPIVLAGVVMLVLAVGWLLSLGWYARVQVRERPAPSSARRRIRRQ